MLTDFVALRDHHYEEAHLDILKWMYLIASMLNNLFLPPPTDPSDHELRGPVGRPGVRPGQRAVPRPQPRHALWLHRRHRGEAARWISAVLAFPRALRQDGRPPVPRESGKGDRLRRHIEGRMQPLFTL